ncbi:MAG: hypothetical protein R6V47_04220 [Candidatus Delongbacteria bacterium]
MIKLKTAAVIIFVIILISCSKKPEYEKMHIELLFTIDGGFKAEKAEDYNRKFTVVSDIEVDSEGILYLFNPRLERIIKFDANGEYIGYFGSRGTGKGEFLNAVDFAIMKDTLYIKNTYTNTVIRYTNDGKFIDYFEDKTGKFSLGENLRAVSDDRFVSYVSNGEKTDEGILVTNNLSILNKKLEETALLREYSAKLDKDNPVFFEFMTKYAYGEGKIFVAENSENEYKINIFDTDGNRTGEIVKEYSPASYNEAELSKIKSLPISVTKTKDERDTVSTKPVYKKSINALFFDKYNRLIVCPSVKRTEKDQHDFIADIFEDGKFVKRVVIPQLKGEDMLYRTDSEIYFKGDRIYEVLHEELKINVYGF